MWVRGVDNRVIVGWERHMIAVSHLGQHLTVREGFHSRLQAPGPAKVREALSYLEERARDAMPLPPFIFDSFNKVPEFKGLPRFRRALFWNLAESRVSTVALGPRYPSSLSYRILKSYGFATPPSFRPQSSALLVPLGLFSIARGLVGLNRLYLSERGKPWEASLIWILEGSLGKAFVFGHLVR